MLSPSMRDGFTFGSPLSPVFMLSDERSEQTLTCVTPEPIHNSDLGVSSVRRLDYTYISQDTGTIFATEYGSSNGNLPEGDNESRCDNHTALDSEVGLLSKLYG
ncbi:hypothetical protein Ddc_05474 [Ditylenchus destructor]|nr:hypothetical protein Ddc_05474 [Ditylenchus destructor]